MAEKQLYNIRWFYLAVGVISLLFAGIIYGWSILKAPLAGAFGWYVSDLALNFTLTMCFFCLGGILGSILGRRFGARVALLVSAVLAFSGFTLVSRLDGGSVWALYLTYGLLAGLGIGVAYNAIISTVNQWFPDKKGLCSGALMMGFGASALILGNLAGALIENPSVGWRTVYLGLGAGLGVVLCATAFLLQQPPEGIAFPHAAQKTTNHSEVFEVQDFSPVQMLHRPTFWRAFICIVFLAAVGNTVISFAMDLTLSVGASASLATTLVGVLSLCNGFGRILTGALYDRIGRRATMLLANGITILAAAVTLAAVCTNSLPLCIVGLVTTGISYGSCPTLSSAFTAAFYGPRYFAVNFSIMNFNIMFASFMATVASLLLSNTGSYTAPFILLLTLSMAAFGLNLTIRRP